MNWLNALKAIVGHSAMCYDSFGRKVTCVCVCVGSLGHHLGEFFVSAIYWRICLPFSMCLFSFHSSFAFGSSSCQKTTTRELDKYKDYLRFVQTPLGGHGGL